MGATYVDTWSPKTSYYLSCHFFFVYSLPLLSLSLNHYLIIIEFILCTLNGQKYQPETQFRGICKNLVRPEVDALRANTWGWGLERSLWVYSTPWCRRLAARPEACLISGEEIAGSDLCSKCGTGKQFFKYL